MSRRRFSCSASKTQSIDVASACGVHFPPPLFHRGSSAALLVLLLVLNLWGSLSPGSSVSFRLPGGIALAGIEGHSMAVPVSVSTIDSRSIFPFLRSEPLPS